MSRAGITSHIAERVIGHTIKASRGLRSVRLIDAEKAHALEALAALVERIVNPPEGDRVVPIRKGAIEGVKALR